MLRFTVKSIIFLLLVPVKMQRQPHLIKQRQVARVLAENVHIKGGTHNEIRFKNAFFKKVSQSKDYRTGEKSTQKSLDEYVGEVEHLGR